MREVWISQKEDLGMGFTSTVHAFVEVNLPQMLRRRTVLSFQVPLSRRLSVDLREYRYKIKLWRGVSNEP